MAVVRIDPSATFKIISQSDSALLEETDAELDSGKLDEKGAKIYNPSRYERYVESSFDQSILKFKDGESPFIFVVRGLKSLERADLVERHSEFDPKTRKNKIKNFSAMLIDTFNYGCLGLEKKDGTLEKVSADEFEHKVTLEIGSHITAIGSLGKNLKKP